MSTVSARQLIHQRPELRGSASSSSGPAAAAETAAQCNGMVAAQQRSSSGTRRSGRQMARLWSGCRVTLCNTEVPDSALAWIDCQTSLEAGT